MIREKYIVVYWKNGIEYETLPSTFEKALQDKVALKEAGYYGYIKRLADRG